MALKALAQAVFERNRPCNSGATGPVLDRNSGRILDPPELRLPRAKRPPRWDAETAALIRWFQTTEPPPGPLTIYPHLVLLRPAAYWDYIRSDIATGPNAGRGYTGALLKDLRRFRELLDGSAK